MEREKDLIRQNGNTGSGIAGEPDWFVRMRSAIYYLLGAIEVLLAFRLLFKLLGANAGNALVASLYSITKGLIAPFSGIFNTLVTKGAAAQYVFEPATIIAMIVYAAIARALVGAVKLRAIGEMRR